MAPPPPQGSGAIWYAAERGSIGDVVGPILGSLRLFLVGAGALGCEFLKNFAMMVSWSGGGW